MSEKKDAHLRKAVLKLSTEEKAALTPLWEDEHAFAP